VDRCIWIDLFDALQSIGSIHEIVSYRDFGIRVKKKIGSVQGID